MKVLSIQPTPNPNAYKFFLDRTLTSRPREIASADRAGDDPLATALFAIDGVKTLFFMDDFVTVTWEDAADWRAVTERVRATLEQHEPPRAVAHGLPEGGTAEVDDQELMERIQAVLDDRVRPALAGDGGGLEVVGLEAKVLRIRYQGACGSCPSSIAGTLMAIQNMLQSEVDEELQVISA
ncbi:MAG TPA: NifU family protein [Planctomycetota bacterium]|nr:NifU family protein [Planctomycetota bacterium]